MMKKQLTAIIAACVLLTGPVVLTTGCATTPQQVVNRAAVAAKLAAYVGASEYMRAHPETRAAFVLARDQLKLIEASEHIDLVTVLAIVQQLPVQQLESPQARLIVTAATLLLTDLNGLIPLSELDSLKPVVQGLREGLDMALLTTKSGA